MEGNKLFKHYHQSLINTFYNQVSAPLMMPYLDLKYGLWQIFFRANVFLRWLPKLMTHLILSITKVIIELKFPFSRRKHALLSSARGRQPWASRVLLHDDALILVTEEPQCFIGEYQDSG